AAQICRRTRRARLCDFLRRLVARNGKKLSHQRPGIPSRSRCRRTKVKGFRRTISGGDQKLSRCHSAPHVFPRQKCERGKNSEQPGGIIWFHSSLGNRRIFTPSMVNPFGVSRRRRLTIDFELAILVPFA